MDTISINKAKNLYWLGRYTERAYTLINYVRKFYDYMVDKDHKAYVEFCERLGIPDKYEDKNDFIKKFVLDSIDTVSISYALSKAYDNAIILRDKLTTSSLGYLQLACNKLKKSFSEDCNVNDLQYVTDYLIAFWGAVDDCIMEDDIRNLIKSGKYSERLDLYSRFSEESSVIEGVKRRLSYYETQLEIGKVSEFVAADENTKDRYSNQ